MATFANVIIPTVCTVIVLFLGIKFYFFKGNEKAFLSGLNLVSNFVFMVLLLILAWEMFMQV